MQDLFRVIASAVAGFRRDQGVMMAGHLAFLGLLSLFPFIIFFTAVAGMLGDSSGGQEAITLALNELPAEVAAVLAKPIREVINGAPGGILTISAIVALWTASTGLDAARMAVRRAFHWAEVQPMIARRLQSTAIAAVAPLVILGVMSVQVVGPAVWALIDPDLLPDTSFLEKIFAMLRLTVTPLALFIILWATFFVFSPRRIRPVALAPGAFTTTLLWLATANGLSLYLRNLADYEMTYGGLAGFMVTLLFFFFLGIGFVLGAEVNAAVTELRKGGNLGTVTKPSAPTPQAPPEEGSGKD